MSDLSPGLLDRTNALLELVVLRLDNGTLTPAPLSPPFSPNPASVAANCLLYASLCCSLFSAAGAVLGKEWLRHFDRKRQVASLGDQARFRQKKVRGIERWYFQETVRLLPYVLLLSVFFFFTGLVPYLLGVNKAVAGVVIAFSVCGTAFWGLTLLSCIIDPLSPYQTSLTFFLHTVTQIDEKPTTPAGTQDDHAGHSRPADSRRGSNNTSDAPQPHSTPPGGGATQVTLTGQGKDSAHPGKHVLNAETVGWLLAVTSRPEDLLVVAQNLCWLEFEAGGIILRNAMSWRRLLCHGLDALQRWRDRPNENDRLTAEYIGAAIRRLLMKEPGDSDRWKEVRNHFHEKVFRSNSKDPQTLSILKSTLLGTTNVWIAEVKHAEYDLRKCFLQMHIAEGTKLAWSLLVGFVQDRCDDIILNLLAVSICTRPEQESDRDNEGARLSRHRLSIEAYHGEDLAINLSNALAKQDDAFSEDDTPESRDPLAQIYVAFFQRVKCFNRDPPMVRNREAFKTELRERLRKFVQNLGDRVSPKTCTLKWVESSMKAVIALRDFPIDDETCKAVCSALAYIVEGAQCATPKPVPRIKLQEFTRTTLQAISSKFPPQRITSLRDNEVLINHFAAVMTSRSPDHGEWLEFFAAYPQVWIPTTDNAKKCWSQTGFVTKVLDAFKMGKQAERESLASIIVHIASTKSAEWCKELLDGALLNFAEQVVTGKNKDVGNGPNVIAAVLRPVAAVLAVHQIDWATDQMYRIVGAIAMALEPADSGLLEEIKGKTYEQSDIEGLVKLIVEVSKRRMYEGGQEDRVTGAVTKLKGIKKTGRKATVIPET